MDKLATFIFFLILLSCEFSVGYRQDHKSSVPAVSKTWVINMNKRSSRLNLVQARLKELKIPYHRYGAIDFGNGDPAKMKLAQRKFHPMTKMNLTLVEKQLSDQGRFDLNWGSTGCWQSHLQIYMQIMNGTASYLPGPYLILEDDVNISSRVTEILSYEYLYKYLPYDWEMLFLDHLDLSCHKDEPDWKRPKDNDPLLHYCLVKFTYQTDAYVIRNPDVAAKLVAAGNSEGVQVADHYTNKLFGEKAIKAYAITKRPVTQLRSVFGTDIQQQNISHLIAKNEKLH
jgi:GR25 family glycosyltransferase involved in LPS biosynthesis